MKYITVSLVSVVMYAIVPVAASAESLSYSGTGPRVFQHWFERNPSLYNVAEGLFKDRFGLAPDTSYYDDTVNSHTRERFKEKSGDSMSDQPTRDSGNVSPGFSGSINGHSNGLSSGFGDGRSSADPSVRDLSRMDGGGFAPPGAYTGSMRRP